MARADIRHKSHNALGSIPSGSLALIPGTAVDFVMALVSVGWLLKYVSTHDFRGFAIYRVIAGALILVLITTGMMR